MEAGASGGGRPLSREKRWTVVEIVARGSHEELIDGTEQA